MKIRRGYVRRFNLVEDRLLFGEIFDVMREINWD